jgi:hypothetical protein
MFQLSKTMKKAALRSRACFSREAETGRIKLSVRGVLWYASIFAVLWFMSIPYDSDEGLLSDEAFCFFFTRSPPTHWSQDHLRRGVFRFTDRGGILLLFVQSLVEFRNSYPLNRLVLPARGCCSFSRSPSSSYSWPGRLIRVCYCDTMILEEFLCFVVTRNNF